MKNKKPCAFFYLKKIFYSLSFICLVFLSFIVDPVQALQTFSAKDGDTLVVKISSRELTRIMIQGKGQLEKVWGAAGNLDIQPDVDGGEIFIRPTASASASFSFFVRDNIGSTYTLVATQQDIPSDTIAIKPLQVRSKDTVVSDNSSIPYIERIKNLIRAMALDQDMDGFSFEEVNKDVPLWRETKITLRKLYTSDTFVGEIYVIQNISDQNMILHEREFLDFGDNVKAISLERFELFLDDTTLLFVVRDLTENQ